VARLILFDIDGTLLRPGDKVHQQALLDAVEAVYQIKASLEGVPLGGMLDSQIVRLALEKYDVPPDDIRSGLAETMNQMGTRYVQLLNSDDRRSWLLPGIEDLLARLEDAFILSVLTGNASGVARAKLAAANIDHHFPFGAYGDSANLRHELVPVAVEHVQRETGQVPQPSEVVLVGDTPRDIEAARASGSKVVAVATGRYSVDDLADHEPDMVFDDLSDVAQVERALENLTAP
jgi:phosphoglycolate phosphatase